MKITSLLLAAFLLIMPAPISHENECLTYCLEACGTPEHGEEWFVIALSAGGYELPEGFKEEYINNVTEAVVKAGGVLTTTRYTEYSRCIIALTLCGADARNIGGYDMTAPLLNMENVLKQGLNGAIFALIALDGGEYAPEMSAELLDLILSRQLEDGGWALGGKISDTDMTAMAVQALSRYRDDVKVSAAIDKALARLSVLQLEDGGYASYGDPNAESCAQVIIALSCLGLEPGYMTKNGISVYDALLGFKNSDGGFSHMAGEGSAKMPSIQALTAMAAMKLAPEGRSIYMPLTPEEPETALEEDIRTFTDSRPRDTVFFSLGQNAVAY